MANNLNNRLTSVENKLNILERSTETKIVYIQGQARTINSVFTETIKDLKEKLTKIDDQIKQMDDSLQLLQKQYEENNRLLNELRPVVGKKRKWWQVI